MRQWSRYFDWLIVLSPEDEAEVVTLLQKEKPVPYVTSWEKMGYDAGEKSGYDRGLREVVEAVLEVRFGPDSYALREEIRKRTNEKELQQLIAASKSVESLDAFRSLLS